MQQTMTWINVGFSWKYMSVFWLTHNWDLFRRMLFTISPHSSWWWLASNHYIDLIMSATASQFPRFTIIYSTVYTVADHRKQQSPASLAFVRGIHQAGEFPAQMASNAENVSIWWRHHDRCLAIKKNSDGFFAYMSLSNLMALKPIGNDWPIVQVNGLV